MKMEMEMGMGMRRRRWGVDLWVLVLGMGLVERDGEIDVGVLARVFSRYPFFFTLIIAMELNGHVHVEVSARCVEMIVIEIEQPHLQDVNHTQFTVQA
jgi:hypothetical protein